MSKFVKTAIAAAMVMGVFTSTEQSLRVTTVLHVFTHH